MNGPGAAICGIGMVTPVGGCALQTATSVQAGINRYADTFVDDDETPVTMALLPDEWLPPLHEQLADIGVGEREERMVRLAGPALEEALTTLPERQMPPLFLAISEPMPDVPLDMDDTVLDHLIAQTGIRLDRPASQIVPSGRAGGFVALHGAISALAAGTEYALVGGVDTFLDAEVLSALEDEGRLLMEGALDGFAPGEGAAFLLLGAEAAIKRDDLTPLGFVSVPGLAQEPGHRYSDVPFRGEGLAAAVAAALGYANGQRMRSVLCSLNGEQLGAKEWGVAVIRNHAGLDDVPVLVHPADCFGDMGAALGPVLIGLSAIGMREEYLPGPSLVWCASDAELRGAVCVHAVA